MSRLTDSYCSAVAIHLITSWMTSLWGIQQMPIAWRPSCFSPLPSLFSPSTSRKTIVTSESKVQRRFAALRCWWGPHREPSAATLWSRLAIWMDSASRHLLQAIMIIRVWSEAWMYTGTTGGLPLTDCWVQWCMCVGGVYVSAFSWKINCFHWIYSFCNFYQKQKCKVIQLRTAMAIVHDYSPVKSRVIQYITRTQIVNIRSKPTQKRKQAQIYQTT